MRGKLRKTIAIFTIVSALATPLVTTNISYAKDTRPVVIEYNTNEGKNLHRLHENSVQVLDINGWHLIAAQTTHLISVGFDWFGIAKSPQFVRGSTYYWLFKPTAEGKSQFNGWKLKDKGNISAANSNLKAFYSALDTDTVTDPARVGDGCTDIKIFKSINKYIWDNYPELCRETIAFNAEHEAELVKIREEKEAEEAKKAQAKISNVFTDLYGKEPGNYININEKFAWSDFLIYGVTPEIDINWLIQNVWYVEYINYDNKPVRFIARFKPFIWINAGENKKTIKTLVFTVLYSEEYGGKCCVYYAQAGDYDRKQVTFDNANFIADMHAKGIPKVDNGDYYTVNTTTVDLDGAGFATRLVAPSPMIFLPTSSTPEQFRMEKTEPFDKKKTIYKFTRMN